MEKKEKDNEYVDFVVTARKYKTTLTAKYKNRKMWQYSKGRKSKPASCF